MISKRTIVNELERLPKLIERAMKKKDYKTALEMSFLIDTLEWVLSDED